MKSNCDAEVGFPGGKNAKQAPHRRRIYLMRHGEVDYFDEKVTDFTQVPLTDRGVDQAISAGMALAPVTFDRAIASGYPRANRTAQLVLDQNHAPVPLEIESGFVEIRGGVPDASTHEALAAVLSRAFDNAAAENETFLPGGEAFSEARQRIIEAMGRLFADDSWRTALVVAHEGVNRIILAEYCGLGLHGVSRFEQDFACFNVLDFDIVGDIEHPKAVSATIKAMNVTAYDPGKVRLTRTAIEHMFDLDFGASRPFGD